MSIIKKPSAVDSPYVDTSPAAPTRLASAPIAGGGVNTVAATVAETVSANANANTASDSTGSNVSYYTAGIEGVNELVTYGRIFDGANVYVTLEQPQYITYNQNYTGSGTVGGANGQIQFNNNGLFAGSANLTFNGSNVTVGGIKTDHYYYANGVPFTAGSNVFTAITMSNTPNGASNQINYGLGNLFVWNDGGWTIGEYNGTTSGAEGIRINPDIEGPTDVTLPATASAATTPTSISNFVGNVVVNTGNSHQWKFGNDGTTQFPDNIIKTGNNQPITIRAQSNGNAYTISYQSSSHWEAYAEDDETGADSAWAWIYAELPTVDTPQVWIENKTGSDGISKRWAFDAAGNLTLPNVANPSINYANGSPYGGSGGGVANKIFNGNTYANIDFPSGNLAVGVNVTPVTGAWINTYGNIVVNDSNDTEGESVIIDSGGNVYVTGTSYNNNFDYPQGYVRKLDPSGIVLWQKGLPNAVNGSDFGSGETLATDGSGNIYWLVNLWVGGTSSPMVIKLNASTGEAVWTTQISGVHYGYDITVNSAGQVFVVTNGLGRITSLDTSGAVLWSFEPSNGGTSVVDTGTYVIMGYINGNVAAYNYSGNILWTNQVFNTGLDVWGLAWDGTDWYAADVNGYIMKISGADNSTILWQRHININGTGGNMFLTWIEYADGYIYATGTGADGSGGNGIITVKIDASTGDLAWARSLEVNGVSQWYWYGHHDISVRGSYYAITGYAYPVNSNNAKQVLAQLPTDGSLSGSTVGPYRYVNVPALVLDNSDVGGEGYNVPSQPAAVSVTPTYTSNTLIAPYPEVNILEPFVTGPVWSFDNTGSLALPNNVGQINTASNNIDIVATHSRGRVTLTGATYPGYDGGRVIITGGAGQDVGNNSRNGGQIQISGGQGVNGGEGGYVELSTYNANNDQYSWNFGNDGNLTLPGSANANGTITANSFATYGNLFIDPIPFGPGGTIVGQSNALLLMTATGPNSLMSVGWAEQVFAPGNIAFIDFNNGQSGNVAISTGNNTGNVYQWNFDNTGVLTTPDGAGGDIALTDGNITGANVVTANTVVSNGNLHLQPSANNSGAYLDIYLTSGPDVHIAGNGENVIVGGDSTANVTVNTNGAVTIQSWNGNANVWIFGNDGNLSVPGNTVVSTPSTSGALNGNSITIQAGAVDQGGFYTNTGGNLNLTGGLGGFNDGGGGGPGGAVNISAGLSADPAGHAGNVTVNSGSNTWTFDYTGNLTTPGSSGDISGANLITTASLSVSGNIQVGNVNTTSLYAIGNISANNISVTHFLSESDMNAVGNAIAGNLLTGGFVSAVGNIIGRQNIYIGNGAAWQSEAVLGNAIFVAADIGEAYVQAAMVNTKGNGSSDWAAYANNGNTDQGWVDMGFTGNTFNDPTYTVTGPNDGYVFAQGNASFGGNLVLATGNIGTTKDLVFATGGFQTGNIRARLRNSDGAFSVTGNILSNGSGQFSGTFDESIGANTVVVLGYAGGTPRILFGTGNTQQTFEIDNDGGTLRFYQPGSTKASLTAGGVFTANVAVTTPKALSSLTAVAGARAFVNDGNLVAAGNFGAQIGGGGSNVVPVWSNGTNWYIG